MAKILVIGYGNPLRGDDGLGWHVARLLERGITDPDIEIIARHQLNPELAEPISRADLMIFIDACFGEVPGEVNCRAVSLDPTSANFFTHHLDISLLLATAYELYGRCPEALACSVSAESFAFDEGLSVPVLSALPVILDRVRAEIGSRETTASQEYA
jgi:hydrogenase maturation protease